MKIAIYTRVSTDHQSDELQLVEVRKYCERQGWEDVEVYSDTISGAKTDRAGLNEMMSEVRRGNIDIVLVYKIDRLARSLSHFASLLNELKNHKTGFISITQGISTVGDSPAAMLTANILGSIAEFERSLISERTKAGINAAKARGVKFGRRNQQSQYVEQIRQLMNEGKQGIEIAKIIGKSANFVSVIKRNIIAKRDAKKF